MGLLSKLKEKTRGVVTAVKPETGVAPVTSDELRASLLGTSGRGIQVDVEDDEIVICWAAKVASVGPDGGGYEYRYRAMRIELDDSSSTAKGICYKTDTEAELDLGGLAVSKSWERGQHVGAEKMHVLAWIGPHVTEGGADESGYKFNWSDLRDPVIEKVTAAGWTYKPRVV